MAFTHVQGAKGTGASGLTIVLGANPTKGNLVCVGVAVGASSFGSLAVTDGNSNSYMVLATQASNTATSSQLAYLLAPANADKTLTVTFSGSASGDCFADEFSFAGATITFDKESVAGTGSNTAINTPSITPTNPNSLLYAVVAVGGDITAPAAGGTAGVWTGCTGNGADQGMGAEYDLSATGATAVNFTQTPTAVWAGLSMAFYGIVSVSLPPLVAIGCVGT